MSEPVTPQPAAAHAGPERPMAERVARLLWELTGSSLEWDELHPREQDEQVADAQRVLALLTTDLAPKAAAWQEALRQAMERAEANVRLHVEREVYEPQTARAVVREFQEQLGALLGGEDFTTKRMKGTKGRSA